MGLAGNVLLYVVIVFILGLFGVIARLTKLCNDTGALQMTNVLLYIVTPGLIIHSFQREFNKEMATGLLIAFGLAIISHLVGFGIARLFFKKNDDQRYRVLRFATAYSNCGFMGIPLISAVFPNNGAFYAVAYIAIFTMLQWTHGVILMSGDKKLTSFKRIILNPTILSMFIALPFFFLSIKLPVVIGKPLEYLAAINTPLAMIIVGINIAKNDIRKLFVDINIYKVAFLRLLLIPIIVGGLFIFLPVDNKILITSLIATACPTAAATSLFATSFKRDAVLASNTVAVTTLLSIITIPLIVAVFSLLKG